MLGLSDQPKSYFRHCTMTVQSWPEYSFPLQRLLIPARESNSRTLGICLEWGYQAVNCYFADTYPKKKSRFPKANCFGSKPKAPVKPFGAGSFFCALWNNEAMRNGKRRGDSESTRYAFFRVFGRSRRFAIDRRTCLLLFENEALQAFDHVLEQTTCCNHLRSAPWRRSGLCSIVSILSLPKRISPPSRERG